MGIFFFLSFFSLSVSLAGNVLNGFYLFRQVKEIVEELKEQKKKMEDENKSENYASIDENLNDIDVKAVQKKVMEEVSESIPSPEEHSFTVTLTRQEITPDNEITNAM